MNQSPGPGDYNITPNKIHKKLKFGTALRFNENKIIGPGPGDYKF